MLRTIADGWKLISLYFNNVSFNILLHWNVSSLRCEMIANVSCWLWLNTSIFSVFCLSQQSFSPYVVSVFGQSVLQSLMSKQQSVIISLVYFLSVSLFLLPQRSRLAGPGHFAALSDSVWVQEHTAPITFTLSVTQSLIFHRKEILTCMRVCVAGGWECKASSC